MNINKTGFRWFSKSCILVLRAKVASALEGLSTTVSPAYVCMVVSGGPGGKLLITPRFSLLSVLIQRW